MTQNENRLDNTQTLITELFDSNDAIKAKFQEHISQELLLFAEALLPAFKKFPSFAEGCAHNLQTGLVGAFVHGVLDDLLISVKLLLAGNLGPSGNTYRQALEGICMSLMCAHADTLLIGEKEQTYWKLVVSDSRSVGGDLAMRQLLKNWERLGLNFAGAKELKDALEAHHQHSHAGRLAWANRIDLEPDGRIHFGGHFDSAKTKGYRLEMKHRIKGAQWAAELIGELGPHVKKLAAAAPARR